MAESISILPTTAADIPTLSYIMVTAMAVDPISDIMFPQIHSDPSMPLSIALGLYQHSFSQPSQHFFKAVSRSTDEIVAFGQLEFLEKEEPMQGEKQQEEKGADGGVGEGAASSPFPPSSEAFNAEFFMMYHGGMAQKLKEYMSRRDGAAGEFLA